MDFILLLLGVLFIGSIFLLSLIFVNRRRAGSLKLSIRDVKFKNQRFILIALFFIMAFDFVEYFSKPDLGNLAALCMFIVMFSTNVVLQYFGIGIFDNGVIFGGVLHSWDRVKAYSIQENILILNIQPKNKPSEYQYRFILKSASKEEASALLETKIK